MMPLASPPILRHRLPGAFVMLLVLALLALLALLVPAATSAAGPDSDGDGLRDAFEARFGVSDPLQRDSDGDGVIDSAEDQDRDGLGDLGEQRFGTQPGRPDSDGDGVSDASEDKDRDDRSNARQQDQRPIPDGLTPTLRSAWADTPPERDACQSQHGSSEVRTCEYGLAGSDTSVVLFGDSHAMMWMPALRPIAEERGWRLITLIKSACMPVYGVHNATQLRIDGGRSCRDWRRNAMAWLYGNPPDHIILAYSDSYKLADATGRFVSRERRPRVWKDGIRRTLTALPSGAKTLVIGDVPGNRENPVICLRKHKGNMSACVTPREPLEERAVEVSLREAVANKGAWFGSLYGKICSYDPCPLVQGDVLMWRDGGHLTRTIVERLTPSVRAMLDETIAAPASRRSRRG